jgi:hypothetical protein
MGSWDQLEAILALGPIVVLFALGLFLSLRSGVVSLTTHQGLACFAGNLWQVLLRLLGYGVGLLALQRFIGVPLG